MRPSRQMSVATCTRSTCPSTRWQLPIGTTPATRVSKATGAFPTRGGATLSDATRLSPAQANSSSVRREVGGRQVELVDERLPGDVEHELAGRLGVVRRSLRPTETKPTTGGSVEKMVVYECGARSGVPSAANVETHATGRGAMAAFMR